jgi:hypothetical protein
MSGGELQCDSEGAVAVGNAYNLAEPVSARPEDFVLIANTFHGVPDKARLTRAVVTTLKWGPLHRSQLKSVPARGDDCQRALGMLSWPGSILVTRYREAVNSELGHRVCPSPIAGFCSGKRWIQLSCRIPDAKPDLDTCRCSDPHNFRTTQNRLPSGSASTM